MTAGRAVQRSQRRHRREHGGGTGHVHLHRRVHRIGGLEADPTGVVHHALAHHDQVTARTRRTARAVGELDHPRRFVAAGVDPEQPAAAERGEGVLVVDLDLQPGGRGDGDRHVGHARRRQVAGRRVGEVAGQLGGDGHHAAALGTSLDRRGAARTGDEHDVGQVGGGRLPLQGAVAVAGEEDALDDRLPGRLRSDGGRRRPASWPGARAWRRPGRRRRRRRAGRPRRAWSSRRRRRRRRSDRRAAARPASGRPCRRSRRRRASHDRGRPGAAPRPSRRPVRRGRRPPREPSERR